LGKDAKSGTSKETATQNGGSLTKRKRGEMGMDKIDIDLMPKDVSNGSPNDDTQTEEETHEEETEKRVLFTRHTEVLMSCRSCTLTLHGVWRGLRPNIHVGRLLREHLGSLVMRKQIP
jgi:hypothetical protein